MIHQLPLSIQLSEQATFDDFYWGEHAALKEQLLRSVAGTGEPQILLWGQAGVGKSHLLQACCQKSNLNKPALYLPLATLKSWGPGVIDGLDTEGLLCVDELDEIAGDAAWEEALFHLYNRVRDLARGTLIFATRHAPRKSLIQLPDLKSRLAAGLVVQVHELSDLDKIAVMCRWAEKRGLELSQVVGQFLLSRCGRNLHDLHALLDRLDNASWVLQRKLTIPFIKTVLDI